VNKKSSKDSKRNQNYRSEPSLSELLHLREYWKTVRKRLWTFVNFFVLLVISVTVFSVTQERIYEATMSLQIDAVMPRYTSFQDVNSLGTGHYLSDQEYYATQHAKLRSRSLAQSVLDQVDTSIDPRFEDSENPVGLILNMVRVEPKDHTRIVVIRCQHMDPEFAEQVCSLWGDTFVEMNMESLMSSMQEALSRLATQVADAQNAVEVAENNLLDFKKEYNVVSLSSEDRQNILSTQMSELTTSYAQAQADRVSKQAELDSIRNLLDNETSPLALSLMVANDLLGGLRTELANRHRERSELAQRYLAQHPRMIAVEGLIAELETQILAEVSNELSRRQYVYDLAVSREGELESALSGRTADVLNLGEQEGEYNRLQREVGTRRTVYEYLLQRLQETDIIQELQVNNVQTIDRSLVGTKPVSPNVPLNISLAVVVGLLGGVSLALFFEYMDNTIKTREEVEALGVPFLGIIPSVTLESGGPIENIRERYLYSYNNPKSAFAEFVRNIRTNVYYTRSKSAQGAHRLLVTSAGPREGKTTSAVNLGITMAASGKRVLLLDADLRRPSLHKAFGLSNERGLSNLLTGKWGAETAPLLTPQKGLFVIPSGPRPPNPAELLGSNAVDKLLIRLDSLFDVIIFDSPPVAAVTDAVVLSQKVDGVVMVVKSFKVGRDLILQAKQQLEDVNANLLGVVLNDFDIQRKSYGYYYYYTYYGAGEGPEERTRFGRRKRENVDS